MYLFDSPQEFFDSPMFQGQRFYDATPYRKWFGWIYIALYDHLGIEEYKKDPNPEVQIKIGRSTNIDRRQKELHRDAIVDGKTQKKCSIVYAWSVPLEIKFESDLKTLLTAYIRPNKTVALSSEIIWGIPIITLINVIQLSIFHTCLNMNFIRTDMPFKLRPPDSILDGDKEYVGTVKFILPHQLVIHSKFSELEMAPKENTESLKEYIFLQDERIPMDTQDTIETPEVEDTYDKVPMYITTTEFMGPKVYPIGSYLNARYKPRFGRSSNHLALIVGYAGSRKVANQYAVRWLEVEEGKPIRQGDQFVLTRDPWQYTTKVFRVKKAFAERHDIPIVTQVDKLIPLRL